MGLAVCDKTPLPSVLRLVFLQEQSMTRNTFMLTFKFSKVEYQYYRPLPEEKYLTFLQDDMLMNFSTCEKNLYLKYQFLFLTVLESFQRLLGDILDL